MRWKIATVGLAIAVTFLLVTNPVVVEAAGQITGKQIKNSSVTAKDVKNRTLTGKDVKDDSLNAADIVEAPFLNSVVRVPVDATSATSTFTKPLPTIPNGTYLVTININATLSASGVGLLCSLYPDPATGTALMASFGSNYGNSSNSSINAAKVVQVTGELALFCASTGTFSTPIAVYNPSEITFTRLDLETTTTPVTRGTTSTGTAGPVPRP